MQWSSDNRVAWGWGHKSWEQQQKQEKKQKVEFQSKIVTEHSQTLYK